MVSVIIPTYNRADTIIRSIESVLCQSYQNFEVIIVDDASTDDTWLLVKGLNDSRIRYLKNDKRMGANGARNIGIQNAVGDYVAFQDSDDIWKSDKLEKQMNMFQNKEDLDIVYSRYMRHYLNGENMLVPNKKFTKDLLQEDIVNTLAKLNVIGTPTMIAKKKCFYECGMFDLRVQRYQDWEINIGFVQRYKYGFIDEALVDAYVSTNSISNASEIEFENTVFIIKKHQRFFETQKTMDIHLAKLANIALNEKRLKDLQTLLGEELFFKSIYLDAEKTVKKQEVVQKNYHFIKEWVNKEKNSYLINSFFDRYSDNSIVIYGFGDIGKLFLNVLTEKNERKIRYVIDRNIPSSMQYKVLSLKMLKHEDLEGIKCIIITAIAYEAEIRCELEEVTAVPIISVYDVITDENIMKSTFAKEF